MLETRHSAHCAGKRVRRRASWKREGSRFFRSPQFVQDALKSVFFRLDINQDGQIDAKDLVTAFSLLGDKISRVSLCRKECLISKRWTPVTFSARSMPLWLIGRTLGTGTSSRSLGATVCSGVPELTVTESSSIMLVVDFLMYLQSRRFLPILKEQGRPDWDSDGECDGEKEMEWADSKEILCRRFGAPTQDGFSKVMGDAVNKREVVGLPRYRHIITTVSVCLSLAHHLGVDKRLARLNLLYTATTSSSRHRCCCSAVLSTSCHDHSALWLSSSTCFSPSRGPHRISVQAFSQVLRILLSASSKMENMCVHEVL